MRASRLLLVSALSAITFTASPRLAQPFELEWPERQDFESLAPLVRGGQEVADWKDWPNTLLFRSPSICTATLVGAQVILTAAHCLTDGTRGTLPHPIRPQERLEISCNCHESYASECGGEPGSDPDPHDIALCYVAAPLTGTPYETVSTASTHGVPGRTVWMVGWGCTDRRGVGKVMSVGKEPITARPQQSHHRGLLSVGGSYDEDGRCIRQDEGAFLCLGDSGGALYFPTAQENPFSRAIIGVASEREKDCRMSFFSDTLSEDFLDFALAWLRERKNEGKEVSICGITQPTPRNCNRY